MSIPMPVIVSVSMSVMRSMFVGMLVDFMFSDLRFLAFESIVLFLRGYISVLEEFVEVGDFLFLSLLGVHYFFVVSKEPLSDLIHETTIEYGSA